MKGKVTYTAEYKRIYYPVEFVVVEENAPALLGLQTSVELGLVERVDDVSTNRDLMDDYDDVFQGLGLLKQTHSIKLSPDHQPVVHPARRVPFRLQKQFDETLSHMVKNKIITKVTEPTEWVNPIVTVRKPSGDLRICLDPLELNKAIHREHYAIPTPSEIVARLHGSQFFSVLMQHPVFCKYRWTRRAVISPHSPLHPVAIASFVCHSAFDRCQKSSTGRSLSCSRTIHSVRGQRTIYNMVSESGYCDV